MWLLVNSSSRSTALSCLSSKAVIYNCTSFTRWSEKRSKKCQQETIWNSYYIDIHITNVKCSVQASTKEERTKDLIHVLFKSVCSNDGVFDVALRVHVQVYSNGRVTWTPPALYCSSCGVKVHSNTLINLNYSIHFLLSFLHLLLLRLLWHASLFLRLGNVLPIWLAELHHAVPLLHVRLDRDRHTIRTGLERQWDQGGATGRGFQWWDLAGGDERMEGRNIRKIWGGLQRKGKVWRCRTQFVN